MHTGYIVIPDFDVFDPLPPSNAVSLYMGKYICTLEKPLSNFPLVVLCVILHSTALLCIIHCTGTRVMARLCISLAKKQVDILVPVCEDNAWVGK